MCFVQACCPAARRGAGELGCRFCDIRNMCKAPFIPFATVMRREFVNVLLQPGKCSMRCKGVLLLSKQWHLNKAKGSCHGVRGVISSAATAMLCL